MTWGMSIWRQKSVTPSRSSGTLGAKHEDVVTTARTFSGPTEDTNDDNEVKSVHNASPSQVSSSTWDSSPAQEMLLKQAFCNSIHGSSEGHKKAFSGSHNNANLCSA